MFHDSTQSLLLRSGQTGNFLNIWVTNPATVSRFINIIDPIADSQFILTTATQTIPGTKIFSSATNVVTTGTTQVLQLRNGASGNFFNIRVPINSTTARFVDIPDVGADVRLVLTQRGSILS